MRHGIRVIKRTMDIQPDCQFTGRRLRVEAVEGCNVETAIFVYKTQIMDAQSQEKKGVFVNVATPADLDELPVNEPNGSHPDYYRSSTVDVVFRNLEYCDRFWSALFSDIGVLMDALDIKSALLSPEEAVIEG